MSREFWICCFCIWIVFCALMGMVKLLASVT